VGSLLGAQPEETLCLRGRWGAHPQYGRQFQVEDYTTVLPATVQGIRRYLGSGLVKGIGPRLAERIVDHFGTDALQVIEEQPGRLAEVPNLGPKRTRLITAAWEEQKAIKEVMVFLQGGGVSTSLAVRIYKQYGGASIGVVRAKPYRLAAEVWGIGFPTADTIATSMAPGRSRCAGWSRRRCGCGPLASSSARCARRSASASRLLTTTLAAEETSISHATVARIWHRFGVQPRRTQTFEFSTDPALEARVRDVVALYLHHRRRRWCSASTRSRRSRRWSGLPRPCRCGPGTWRRPASTTSGTAPPRCSPP
jgi:hypothetical protein